MEYDSQLGNFKEDQKMVLCQIKWGFWKQDFDGRIVLYEASFEIGVHIFFTDLHIVAINTEIFSLRNIY